MIKKNLRLLKKSVKPNLYYLKCKRPVEDEIFSTKEFKDFLMNKIKANKKIGSLKGGLVSVEVDESNSLVSIVSTIKYSKRYLKYLTKKYLKLNGLRDYIRVLADTKNSYELRYYTIQEEDKD